MKEVIKANEKNYKKLVKKGFSPVFATMRLSHSVKYFIVHKDKTFSNSIKRKWTIVDS